MISYFSARRPGEYLRRVVGQAFENFIGCVKWSTYASGLLHVRLETLQRNFVAPDFRFKVLAAFATHGRGRRTRNRIAFRVAFHELQTFGQIGNALAEFFGVVFRALIFDF